MTPYLIIDGYNLMHAAGIARRSYAAGDLQRCRSRLQSELAMRLAPEVLSAAVIVYDAFDSTSNDERNQQQHGVNLLFAAQGEDADSLIERLLQQHSVPRRVIVVSSDHRLHDAASRRRARCVDSEDFWFGLEGDGEFAHTTTSTSSSAVKAPTAMPGEEVQAELQQWAEQLAADNHEADKIESSAVFDKEYLRQLKEDIDSDRLR
ncbi:MAG: NYN domain-containing protein [Planctomycetaceae bacterium]